MTATILSALSLALWAGILLSPWRPWSTRERLEAVPPADEADLADITVLIPARDEAETIAATLASLARQGRGLRVIVVDDESRDGTAERARGAGLPALRVIAGARLPCGWSGKLWALEQARRAASTPYLLLLDADILAAPGLLAALKRKAAREGLAFVSLMAHLRMKGFWEVLLMPAFVYFFKLLYPFAISNSRSPLIAAAAGGCILVRAEALEAIGGFAALKGALIDDCTLARRIKQAGYRSWIGLTHSATSLRRYPRLGDVWAMVARSAFTQLRYSPLLLLLCTGLLGLGCWLPPLALAAFPGAAAKGLAAAALGAMALGYLPTLRYYRLSPLWALAMPLIGTLFLAMTWSSAFRYWRGRRAAWKGRIYAR